MTPEVFIFHLLKFLSSKNCLVDFLIEFKKEHCTAKKYTQKELFNFMVNNTYDYISLFYKDEFDEEDLSNGFIDVELSFNWGNTKQDGDFWAKINTEFEIYIINTYYKNLKNRSNRTTL